MRPMVAEQATDEPDTAAKPDAPNTAAIARPGISDVNTSTEIGSDRVLTK